jgi:uncharacterized membrane protein YeaQ/YmgE (transglycosylase-associated protein family)
MAVIGWTIVGLVAGLVTTAMFRKHGTGGPISALGVGVAGAIAGGGALAAVGVAELGEFFDLAAWLIVLGLVLLLLAAYNVLTRAWTPALTPDRLAPTSSTHRRREACVRRGTGACPPASRTPPGPRARRRPEGFPTESCRQSSSR